jgi:hypothetical protein
MIEADVVKYVAVPGHGVGFKLLRGIGRSLHLGLNDDATTDEIQNISFLGVTADRELSAWEVAE